MLPQRAYVTVQYHFDAVSIWLNRFGFTREPGKHSRGLFGVNVGAPRLLDLHDRLDVPATWFIPGHTIESFPDICGDVWDRGYDVQHHGWSHADQSVYDDKDEVRADMVRGIEAIEALTGRPPTGYSSNRWGAFTGDTLDLLVELGFEWDSSLMGREFTPYYVPTGWSAPQDEPYDSGEETDLIEFPVSWRRDDWPHLQIEKGVDTVGAAVDETRLFRSWREQFDWMYDNVDGGVFNLTLHPQVIGQAPLTDRLETLFEHMSSKPGVEFTTFEELSTQIRAQS
ncbi:MAG: polysaccharide deacetylase family protein [Halobacteriota archaeon]